MNNPANKVFLEASDVSSILGISISHAYKVIKQLNQKYSDKYISIRGKVNKKFLEDSYGISIPEED